MGNESQLWVKWFDSQDATDRRCIALAAIERLIKIQEVGFRIDDIVRLDGTEIPEDETVDECLYWTGSGEDLRTPF